MDQPALRDVERWKDKIEVRLDNRQVFFLFFGSAMVACMLFVLGVIVGKRLETRGRAEAPALEDPLAVLDRFGGAAMQVAPAPLAFPRALIGGGPTTVSSGKARASAERLERSPKIAESPGRSEAASKADSPGAKATLASTMTAPALVRPPAAEPAAPAAVPVAARESGKDAKESAREGARPATMAKAANVEAPVTASSRKLAALPRPLGTPGAAMAGAPAAKAPVVAAPVAQTAPTAPLPRTATAKPVALAAPVAKLAPSAAAPAPAASAAVKGKGHFLLQLSSFQDRSEADAFARRFAGQNAYVVATEIPGKGTWYRVRVGSYGTMSEAAAAKVNFERDHNVIAYVAGSGPAK